MVTPGKDYLLPATTKDTQFAAYRNLFEKELSPEPVIWLRDFASKGCVFGGSKTKEKVVEIYRITGVSDPKEK